MLQIHIFHTVKHVSVYKYMSICCAYMYTSLHFIAAFNFHTYWIPLHQSHCCWLTLCLVEQIFKRLCFVWRLVTIHLYLDESRGYLLSVYLRGNQRVALFH